MDSAHVAADVVVYSTVLDACAKATNCERAELVFKQMRSRNIAPNVVSYASLARPYAHKGDWEAVERLAQTMKSEGLEMNEYFLYAQLLAYATAQPRQSARAEQTLREAVRSGIKVNKFVVTAAVRAMGRMRCDQILSEMASSTDASKIPPRYAATRKPG
jgi:pentatricopeptide repeat domain-containing protein 1